MAREKLSDADADADKAEGTDGPTPAEESSSGKKAPPAKKSTSRKKAAGPGQKAAAEAGKKAAGAGKKEPAKESATAQRAAQARTVMQRQHRRIEFARAAAVGVEAAGAAGLVVGGLLAWEWGDRLWGRTDGPGVVVQAALAATVLALLIAWVWRGNDQAATWARSLAIAAALVVAGAASYLVWQAPLGARGAGGVVAAVAAVLAIAGAVGWLLGLRRLRRLFAFGMGYARDRGYGNLTAVRRAQLIGAPAGAVGAAAVVTGALLVVPAMVTTEDSGTAAALALSGEAPAGDAPPSWEIELDATVDPIPGVRATPAGLVVDEVHGVRVVDPRTGDTRWHWRDEAYLRAAAVTVDDDRTIVLALRYQGEPAGHDRVVGLDTATGELRWEQVDSGLVTTMAAMAVSSPDGDWFAVPSEILPPEDPEFDPGETLLGVRVVGADGATRWSDAGGGGCRLASIGGDSPDVVLVSENCPVPEAGEGAEACRISGRDAADGRELWSWPTDERIDPDSEAAAGCQATTMGGLVLLTYQLVDFDAEPGDPGPQPPALALDPRTGAEVWAAERDDDSYSHLGVDGLNDPQAVVGDTVVGIEWPGGQPNVGQAVLIPRDLADGSRSAEIELPDGIPIGVRPAGGDRLVISQYWRDEQALGAQPSERVVLLEVDLGAGEVVSQTLVIDPGSDRGIGWVGLAVGPETLAVDTLVGTGPEDVRLVVHGFG